MKIGILADTHDNLPKIQEAVSILNERAVERVFHCGDYVAPFALKPLHALACDWRGVFGNNDGEKKGLHAASHGTISPSPLRIELSGKLIALMHSYALCEADIILFGHTHEPQTRYDDATLLINPGEASGWLSGRSSLAILDLDTMKPEIIYF